MADFTTDKCFGCDAPLEPAPGNFYCDVCVAEQEAEAAAELEAFDAFHAWADGIARQTR